MKLLNGKQHRKRSIKLAIFGLTLISVAVLILVLDPIQLIVDDKLSVYDGSFLLSLFKNPPLDVFISAYAFNITNLDRFLKGEDKKIKLAEVGPYVYQEFLENRNVTFHENNTMSYRPVRRVKFIPEKSVGDPSKDVITVPNVPYMGVTTAASKISIFAALAINALMKTLRSEVVLNITVHDYFWGYDDPLVRLASTFIPNVVHFERFGLLDRVFDEGENLVSIHLPGKRGDKVEEESVDIQKLDDVKDDRDYSQVEEDVEEIEKKFVPNIRDFSIDNWNGKKGLSYWGYNEHTSEKNTECNTLRGTYDGTLFPRNITKGDVFRIYRKPFCRTLPVVFSHPGSLNGIDAFFFKLTEDAFDSNITDPKSSCYCTDDVCLKKGLGNITPCYYNIPAAASFPHFFNADPSLLAAVDGLNPSEEKHGTEIVLQPQLGVPMRVHSRLQVNLMMGEVMANTEMRPFKNIVLPIFWLEIAVENLTPGLQVLLHLLFNICPYVQTGAIYILILAGVSLMGISALVFLCVPKPMNDFNPKLDKRYSAIYLFPYIRRELSKIGDEECMSSKT